MDMSPRNAGFPGTRRPSGKPLGLGGSHAATVTSDRHAARLTFQSEAILPILRCRAPPGSWSRMLIRSSCSVALPENGGLIGTHSCGGVVDSSGHHAGE